MVDTKIADTAEYTAQTPLFGTPPHRPRFQKVVVDLGAESHTGNVRKNNEDHYLVVCFRRVFQALLTNVQAGSIPELAEEIGYSMLVADGMGGAAGGEVASREAIATLVNLALDTPDWIMWHDGPLAEEVLRRAKLRLRKINEALREMARDEPALTGMGTTLTVACTVGADVIYAHVGDSRAYVFRQGSLRRLTHDHTVAQALADAGAVSPEEAEKHPLRHVLTSVLGQSGDQLSMEVGRYQLEDGDALMLCTDGLSDVVEEAEIVRRLNGPGSAADVCRTLVDAALERGGRDNVTVVLARYRFPEAGELSPP
jgi:protein phosphatase